jgi:hypothetical protein
MLNKRSNSKKDRRLHLLLCGVILLSFFVKIQMANSASPQGKTIQTFSTIDFVDDKCWNLSVGSGNIVYTNNCFSNSYVLLTLLDGVTQRVFIVAPQGKLILLGGSVVHIIKEVP